MRNFVIVAATMLLLSGCAAVPHEDPAEKAAEQAWMRSLYQSTDGFGAYPDDYQQIVEQYMAEQLKDPESARYSKFRDPKKDLKIVDAKKRVATLGYSTCVDINAKNSYGGYTGAKRHWFLIRDGKVVDSLGPELAGFDPTLENAMTQLIDITCSMPKVKQ